MAQLWSQDPCPKPLNHFKLSAQCCPCWCGQTGFVFYLHTPGTLGRHSLTETCLFSTWFPHQQEKKLFPGSPRPLCGLFVLRAGASSSREDRAFPTCSQCRGAKSTLWPLQYRTITCIYFPHISCSSLRLLVQAQLHRVQRVLTMKVSVSSFAKQQCWVQDRNSHGTVKFLVYKSLQCSFLSPYGMLLWTFIYCTAFLIIAPSN